MTKKKSKGGKAKPTESTEDLIHVDPSRVRFQHSKIRPQFSGCGRSVTQTLDDLRQGIIQPSDIPPIQVRELVLASAVEMEYHTILPYITFVTGLKVIVGPDTEQGLWYFSLNNRRLWVFKRLREEGLLPNNQIAVRVRLPKSESEKNRYSLENCALEAKLMREGPPTKASALSNEETLSTAESEVHAKEPGREIDKEADAAERALESIALESDGDDDASSDEDSSAEVPDRSNPFSVLG